MDVEDDYWDTRPNPSDDEIAEVCQAWIRYQQRWADTPDYRPVEDDPDWWGVEAAMDAEHDPSRRMICWRVILCLCSLVEPNDESTIGDIAAGPLETFLFHSEDPRAMDLVEPAADRDPVLLAALRRVWGWSSPLRRRVDRYLEARGQAPS